MAGKRTQSQHVGTPAEQALIPVIGIGASAGGLQALEEFFDACPPDAGAAFVVVQHLSPSHDSLMEGLLAKHNVMPVRMLKDSAPIEADHVYLIPPGSVMRLQGNMLQLTPRESGFFLPIDIFFESLARERGGTVGGCDPFWHRLGWNARGRGRECGEWLCSGPVA